MRLLSQRNNNVSQHGCGVFRPQMTSLIDVMTILLVFLIKNFSVSSDIVSPPPNVDLPVSASEKPAQPRCAITITKEEIIADDRVLANVAEVKKNAEQIIEPLYAVMKSIQPLCLVDSVGSIVILCDKDVQFTVVKRVMATSSRAGITNFSVLVLKEDG
ncbi:MAG: biopolymer transporter ExbD [Chitinispirillales bacterium]|nr:biopolymer transporter ExbD [Chitinispirillales bacterium]